LRDSWIGKRSYNSYKNTFYYFKNTAFNYLKVINYN